MTATATPQPKRRLRALPIAAGAAVLAALLVPPLARNLEHGPLDASARRQAPGQFVTLSHGIVHVRIAGPEQGRPVLLVHGFSVPKADLVGLSMGGAIAGRFAAAHPERVRSLALVAPLTQPREIGALAWPGAGEWLMRAWYLPRMAASQLEDFPHPERVPGWPERFRPQMRYDGFGRAILSTMRHLVTQSSLPDFEKVGRIGLPVLLVWGERDATVPYAQHAAVRRAIPQAQFVSLPATGHLAVVEEPALTDTQLAAFFKRH